MLTVFGSVALDTIRTKKRTVRGALGGAASFAAVSSSRFCRTGLVGVVGGDFPSRYRRLLASRADLAGLEEKKGRTFRYDGAYDADLTSRRELSTKLGVLAGFSPDLPEEYRRSKFVYLANNDPDQNVRLLGQFDRVRFSACDTISYWISRKKKSVVRMMSKTDAVIINDEEARMLTGEHNLLRCARAMRRWGAGLVVIKKAEHGALLFYGREAYPVPGMPLERVLDPTGAGDSFAGAMMGHLASSNSVSLRALREAAVRGAVMGSFAVEGYGLAGLLQADGRAVSARLRKYRRLAGI